MGSFSSGRAPDFPGLNIRAIRQDSLNGIRFDSNRSDPTSANDVILYRGAASSLKFWDGSSATTLGSAGAVANFSLNDAYDDGRTITADAGAVAINSSGAGGGLIITDTGTGARLELAGAGSGNDITGVNWSVTHAGAIDAVSVTGDTVVAGDAASAGVFASSGNYNVTLQTGNSTTSDITIVDGANGDVDITLDGTGAVNINGTTTHNDALVVAAGDVQITTGHLALTDDQNAESVTIINNTATTIGAAATAGVVQIESTSLTTGVALNVQLTEGTLNGGFYYGAWDATGGSRVFSVGENGAVVIAGAAGTDVFTVTAGDLTVTDGSLSITDADNAETVTIINNTATTIGAAATAGVVQIESTSLTTGALLNLQLTEGTLNGGWYLRAWDATGSAAVFSVGENGATVIAGSAAGTDAVTVTAGDVTLTSGHLVLTSGNATLTAGNLTLTLGDFTVTDGFSSLTVADTSNHVVLTTNQNDTTNNNVGVQFNNAGTGNDVEVINTGAGAAGAVVRLYHNSASPAAADVAGRILFDGEDSASAVESYGRIDVVIRDTTGANPDADMIFYVDVAGTLTQRLELNDGNGINVGDGAAAGIVASQGNFDLTLQTGNSTTGSITITDGANGNISLTPNGSGEIVVGSGSAVAVVASNGDNDLRLETGNATTGTILFTDGANGNIAITPNGSGKVDLANAVLMSKTQSITGAGAVDVVSSITEIDTTGGAAAYTLADGTEGQLKYIIMKTDAGDGTLTPTHLAGGTTITFNDVGDGVTLLFTNGAWYIVGNNGATIA